MKKIKICNYEILNFEQDPLVYSSAGITKITDDGLFNALKEIVKKRGQAVTRASLKRIFKRERVSVDSAISFLKNIKVLGEEEAAPALKKAVIYCDWPIGADLVELIRNEGKNKIELRKIADVSLECSAEPVFFIIATLKLDVSRLKDVYFGLCNKNPLSAISLGFSNGSHFHLTEPYVPSLGNPCAFCTINRVIYYEGMMPSQHQWSKLLAFCSNKEIPLPAIDSDGFKKLLIMMLLARSSKKMILPQVAKTTQDETLQALTIDLESDQVTHVPSVHWPICNCLSTEL